MIYLKAYKSFIIAYLDISYLNRLYVDIMTTRDYRIFCVRYRLSTLTNNTCLFWSSQNISQKTTFKSNCNINLYPRKDSSIFIFKRLTGWGLGFVRFRSKAKTISVVSRGPFVRLLVKYQQNVERFNRYELECTRLKL